MLDYIAWYGSAGSNPLDARRFEEMRLIDGKLRDRDHLGVV